MAKLVDFVLCEDARLEVGGLMTLVGYLPGAVRVPGPGNLKVVCILVLEEMVGVERLLMQVETVLGEQSLYKSGLVECRRQPNVEGHTIVHAIAPFPAPAPGRYLVRVTFEIAGKSTVYEKRVGIDMPVPSDPPKTVH
jgi:hypothetical protein